MAISRKFHERFEAYMMAQLRGGHHADSKKLFRGALTVSREAGARAIPVCEILADYLSEEDETAEFGWTLHDKDFLERIIRQNDFPEVAAKRLEKDDRHPVDDYIAELLGAHHSEWTQFHHTTDTVRKLARLGNAIVIGRGGNFITADLENAFHIRLIGAEAKRLAYIQRSQNLGKNDALDHLHRADHDRRNYVRSHLRRDIADPLAYHAIIRTDDIPDEVLARMIGDLFMDWVSARTQTAGKLIAFV